MLASAPLRAVTNAKLYNDDKHSIDSYAGINCQNGDISNINTCR